MKYTGITTGPISYLMQQCRKTRHIWGTSYLFSHLMKQVLETLGEDFLQPRLLIPALGTVKTKGAGITPDNIILQHQDDEQLLPRITAAIEQSRLSVTRLLNEAQAAYFTRIVKIYAIEIIAETGNPVEEINRCLHLIDLQSEYDPQLNNTGVEWTGIIDTLNKKMFFGEADIGLPFPSINLVAARPLSHLTTYSDYGQADEDTQDEFYKKLQAEIKNAGGELNNFYKYIAVVVADGDKIGKTIAQAGNHTAIVKELARVFTSFAGDAVSAIYEYGGLPVYAGGDDLKFFAPVAGKTGGHFNTIFLLADALSRLFKEKIAANKLLGDFYAQNPGVPQPTLSLGIHISYYKYPLYEAIQQAEDNLHSAKRQYGGDATSFTVRKHSGHHFGAVLERRHEDLYKLLLGLTGTITPEQQFISSIMRRMRQYGKLFHAIEQDKEKIIQFIRNSYDEDVHDQNRAFLDAVAAAIVTSAAAAGTPAKKTIAATGATPFYEPEPQNDHLNSVYSALRFVHFINDTEDER